MNWHLFYEYSDGLLFAKTSNNPKYPAGRQAGFIDRRGYVRVKLTGKMTFAHRIVWEMHKGPIPEGYEIDHINGIKTDNRIDNLRLADRFINCKNTRKRVDNSSGVTGVSKTYNGKWVVQIQVNGDRKATRFDTMEEAEAFARSEYEKNVEFTERHGK